MRWQPFAPFVSSRARRVFLAAPHHASLLARGRQIFLFVLGAATLVVVGGGACPPPMTADGGDGGRPVGDGDGDGDLDAGNPPGTPDGGPDDAGSALTTDELAQRLCETWFIGLQNAAAHSQAPNRCSAADAIADTEREPDLLPDTSLDCLPGKPIFESFFTALTGGRVAISQPAFERCLASARAIRLSQPTRGDFSNRDAQLQTLLNSPDCQGALEPALSAGDSCVQSWDCPLGTGCEAEPLDGTSLTCLAPAPQGSPCGNGADGVALRSCIDSTACFNGLCVFRRGAGQLCGPGEVPCDEALICGPAGTCAVELGLGDICGNDAHCAAPAFCRQGACALELTDGEICESNIDRCGAPCSVCRPSAPAGPLQCLDRGAAGTPCLLDDACRQGFHCAEQSCTANGVVGASCGAGMPCLLGLTCSGPVVPLPPDPLDGGALDGGLDAGTPPPPPPPPNQDGGEDPGPYCQVPSAIGTACAQGALPCAGGACVSGVCRSGAVGNVCLLDQHCVDDGLCVTGKCILAPRADAPCSADGRCAADLFCDGERCLVWPPAGDACGPGDRCADNAFCDEGTCILRRPPGQPCLADDECTSDVCLITLTCAAQAPSCLGSDETFTTTVLFGFLVPIGWWRRRTKRSRSAK